MTGQTSQTSGQVAANGSIVGWLLGGRDNDNGKSASTAAVTPAKEDPTLPPAASGSEPPPIISDILPPRAATHSPTVQFAPPAQGDAGSNKGTKYTTDAERRKAITEALKRRRTSGANDQSHGQQHKRQQMGTNIQPSLLSPVPPPTTGRPSESTPTSSTSTSASTSEGIDVEMMDPLDPILPPEVIIPDDSNDGDWEEGSQASDGSVVDVDHLVNSQLQAATAEVAKVEYRALDNTPSGRPYLRWKNKPMYGALIPDGYERSSARSGFPWICPVRSCRKLFPTAKQLGCHFVRQHRGSLLHDNMDGTLSVRGHYAQLRDGEGVVSGGKPKPGIVVSVGPLAPSESPMVAPSLPEQGRSDPDDSRPQPGAGSEYSAAQSPATSLAKVSSAPTPGDGFEFAEPGRRYTEWADDDGDPRSLCGAMMPLGYTECMGPKPFPCPIRNCESECIRVKDLGCHFSVLIVDTHFLISFQRAHYASYLKDNGDGTFDLIGAYAPKRGNVIGSGKIVKPRPSIVVAQTRPDGSVEWAANWPELKRHMLADVSPANATVTADVPMGEARSWPPNSTNHTEAEQKAVQRTVAEEEASQRAVAEEEANQRAWADMTNQRAVPEKNASQQPANQMNNVMAGRPLRRVPGTNRMHMNDWLPGVTLYRGDMEIRGYQPRQSRPPRPSGKQPGLPLTWLAVNQKFPQAGQVAQVQQVPQVPQAEAADMWRDDTAMEGVEEDYQGPSTRSKLRTQTSESGYVYPQPLTEPEPSVTEEPEQLAVKQQRQPPNSLVSTNGPSNGVMATGVVIAEQVLEMEEWEVAPGRIRETDTKSESIAFSKSFLSSTHAVEVCEDVAFRVDVIGSGHHLKIEGDPNQIRLVSLASGKLRVKIGEEPEFVIGPHGMFKVKAGVSCTVSNRMYIDAVMHTTVLNGFT
ncbi:hypothetical protein QBC41DRAFT_397695 [Cercophora samala]|uniref:C2H2-type domain-containing protein n=1 Tax=Cercophora samala TaxID=330535 RepID=A0AA40D7Z2_9PEZI|nr:hypothetical protein QBC41DRAFT_397695 [Cercophora samala]